MSGSANAETTAERHQMRAKDLDREVRALASAPGHVCFSLTEDLHGCRSADRYLFEMSFRCCVHAISPSSRSFRIADDTSGGGRFMNGPM